MPYFERKDQEDYTRQFDTLPQDAAEWEEAEEYDDGFDALAEGLDGENADLPEPEADIPDPAVRRQARQRKFRIWAGVGDLGAVLTGAAVILALVAFLISMLRFVSSDFSRTFSLWQTKF